MKNVILSICFCAIALSIGAQVARVQIIHNSADTSVAFVDVYIDGVLTYDSLQFHEATAFANISSGIEHAIAFTPASADDISAAVFTAQYNFSPSSKNILIANGSLDSEQFQPFQAFSLDHYNLALEASNNASGTSVLFCNGGTDAGVVDLKETELIQLTAFEDIEYSAFSGYLELFTADYVFTLSDASGVNDYASFSAPFAQFGWSGDAVTIVSSGFLNQSTNDDGEALGLWAVRATGGMMTELPLIESYFTAQVQFIHNSADLALQACDVYINGELYLENFEFRNASALFPLTANGGWNDIAIALAGSGDATDAFYEESVQMFSGQNYVIMLHGMNSSTGYDPLQPFELVLLEGIWSAGVLPSDVNCVFVHGATDAPGVDVYESAILNSTLADNLQYGSSMIQVNIASDNYVFDVLDDANANVLSSYLAPLTDLGVEGQTVIVVASGFVNPDLNSNGSDFGLWLSTIEGGNLLQLLPVPEAPVFANVQLIHNSADNSINTVDVYVDGEIALDDFSFQEASAYLQVQVNDPILIGLAPSSSVSAEDVIAEFELGLSADENYVAMISGIISSTGYNPAPALDVHLFNGSRLTANAPADADFLFFNGSTDAPAFVMNEITIPVANWVSDLAYSDFQDYLSLEASNDYAIQVTNSSASFFWGNYALPANGLSWEGNSIVIFSSGFINPANNSDGENFGMWAAFADGTVIQLDNYVGVGEHNENFDIAIFPNPADDLIQINAKFAGKEKFSMVIYDADNREIAPVVSANKSESFVHSFNCENLSQGVYYLRVVDEHSSQSFRFVVLR